jgi:hypothetical protein
MVVDGDVESDVAMYAVSSHGNGVCDCAAEPRAISRPTAMSKRRKMLCRRAEADGNCRAEARNGISGILAFGKSGPNINAAAAV